MQPIFNKLVQKKIEIDRYLCMYDSKIYQLTNSWM